MRASGIRGTIGTMRDAHPPSEEEQVRVEFFRAQLNRRERTPEELIERRSRHDRFVGAMRAEVARLARHRSDAS